MTLINKPEARVTDEMIAERISKYNPDLNVMSILTVELIRLKADYEAVLVQEKAKAMRFAEWVRRNKWSLTKHDRGEPQWFRSAMYHVDYITTQELYTQFLDYELTNPK